MKQSSIGSFFGGSDKKLVKKKPVVENKTETTCKEKMYYDEHCEPLFIVDGRTVKLSDSQMKVLNFAIEGKNVFFTGSAGTGKSTCLKVVIEKMYEIHGKANVFVTASTGIAACNIGGTTLHSFAGCGLGEGNTEAMITKVLKRKDAAFRWKQTKVLIVDEISMISPQYFELLDSIGRRLRKKSKHLFGGIQIIVAGDFLQLPYVQNEEQKAATIGHNQPFLFETKTWQLLFNTTPTTTGIDQRVSQNKMSVKTNGEMVHLTKIYRQTDVEFIEMLQAFRVGQPTKDHITLLKTRVHAKLDCSDGIKPTKLFCKRVDVKLENDKELSKITGKGIPFFAEDKGEDYGIQLLEKHCQAPKTLELKVGCQVVLLRNLDFAQGLVNGARGVVVSFVDEPRTPVVKFTSGVVTAIALAEWKIEQGDVLVAKRTQIPLSLCWASSIHKSMGMTLDKVVTQLGDVFECGQLYTALSRCTSLAGLSVLSFNEKCILAHPRVVDFYESLSK